MKYRTLDMASYKRKAHFDLFMNMTYPYVGITAEVDITRLLEIIQSRRLPFFLTACYCIAQAANDVPELRQRVLDGRIVEFERCRTSHTVALEDGTYCYCPLENDMPFAAFLPYAQATQQKAKAQRSIEEDPLDTLDQFFLSTTPWISYTDIVQPVTCPADSHPRLTWGKYRRSEGRTVMPVTALCHHALVDGIHIARFYEALDRRMAQLCGQLEGNET